MDIALLPDTALLHQATLVVAAGMGLLRGVAMVAPAGPLPAASAEAPALLEVVRAVGVEVTGVAVAAIVPMEAAVALQDTPAVTRAPGADT